MPDLYQHQRDGVGFLLDGSRILGHEAGLGKTLTTLTAYQRLGGPTALGLIVVCPAIARQVWVEEARGLGLTLTALSYEETPPLVPRLRDVLSVQPTILVLDESHYVRTPQSKRHQAAAKLAPFAERVWLLTGTPMVNSALDIHHQGRLLGGDYPFLRSTPATFGRRWCEVDVGVMARDHARPDLGARSWRTYHGVKDEGKLMGRLSGVMQRRRKVDCLDLPEKLRLPMWVHRQPEMGVDYTLPVGAALQAARHALAGPKAKLTIDYLNQALTRRPVVVFGYHTEFLRRVQAHFRNPAIILGGQSDTARREIVARFNAGKVAVLPIQLEAGGHAISLRGVRDAVFGEIEWSAVALRQAEDRIHGIGRGTAESPNYHYLLAANSVDELVWNRVLDKGAAIDRADDAAASAGLRDLALAFGRSS